jgi:hypothetical protein
MNPHSIATKLNHAKTKVVSFSKGKCTNTPFYFNNAILDIVEDFSYLGVSLILMVSSIKLLNTCVTKLEKLRLLYLKNPELFVLI